MNVAKLGVNALSGEPIPFGGLKRGDREATGGDIVAQFAWQAEGEGEKVECPLFLCSQNLGPTRFKLLGERCRFR